MDWLEKYKPKCLDDVVGNKKTKEAIAYYINNPSEMPHLLFAGKTGTGKTTLAHILAHEILKENFYICFKEYNASHNNSVDFVREEVIRYMKYPPMFLNACYKILLLDECDYLTPEAQACLRRPLEVYKKNCRVIMTCNNINKIIDEIKEGRAQVFIFNNIKEEMKKRLKYIAECEGLNGIDIDDVIEEANGSVRNAITILQQKAIIDEKDKLKELLVIK